MQICDQDNFRSSWRCIEISTEKYLTCNITVSTPSTFPAPLYLLPLPSIGLFLCFRNLTFIPIRFKQDDLGRRHSSIKAAMVGGLGERH